jgi:CheY-like chemotaxis protein
MAVDDDATNRMIIEKILNHLNVNVCIADSGQRAVSAFLEQSFDLILMDIEMPDMDGYETTQAIRKLEMEGKLDPTLIIALSAHVAPEFKTKALESGMDDFFNKPVQIAKLKKCLDALKASA